MVGWLAPPIIFSVILLVLLGLGIAYLAELLHQKLFSGIALNQLSDCPQEIPFEIINGCIYVNVKLNGRAIRLLLDTGASLSAINSLLVDKFELERTGKKEILGIGGEINADVVRVNSLIIGQWEINDLDLSAFSMLNAFEGGLIGNNILRHFTVTIDYNRKILRLDREESGGGK